MKQLPNWDCIIHLSGTWGISLILPYCCVSLQLLYLFSFYTVMKPNGKRSKSLHFILICYFMLKEHLQAIIRSWSTNDSVQRYMQSLVGLLYSQPCKVSSCTYMKSETHKSHLNLPVRTFLTEPDEDNFPCFQGWMSSKHWYDTYNAFWPWWEAEWIRVCLKCYICLDGRQRSYKIIISLPVNCRLQRSLWHVMITLCVMRGAKQHASFAFPPLPPLMFLHDESIP